MNSKLKTGILIALFSVLFLPMLQKAFPIIKSKELNGEYIIAKDVDFNFSKWFADSFWVKKDRYINDNMGLRTDLIRLNNEMDYSLFQKIHSEWRLIGNDNCVFQDMYIYSYLGRDYDGYPFIKEKVRKLKAIQDTLARLGKSMILIHPPCKAFYYPEYFPEQYKEAVHRTTNFETYKRLADSMGVNQVDLNSWFVAMKGKSKELLYPKLGFHWSIYGSLLAADSVEKFIEKLRNIKMIHPVWTKIEHTDKARDTDDDIEKTMNLIVNPEKEIYSYPEVQYAGDKTATKPNIIYVGDSFLFQWVTQGVLNNTENNWQIWYYNMLLINRDIPLQWGQYINENDCINEINKADCLVIMFTSRNLSKLAKTFIEKTYEHYYPGK